MNAFEVGQTLRRELPKLPFEICIAINRYLAPASAPRLLHRVAEGGPVTYVFLGRVNARLFLLHCTIATQPAPPPSATSEPAAAKIIAKPVSALTLKQEWLDLILTGSKTWEIRSQPTNKRERVALAQSGTTVLRGDVEIVNCVPLDAQSFVTSIDKHCVPQNRHTEVIGGYAKIFAWELARPRRYRTPISYKRMPGQVGWVNLHEQLHIFDNVLVEDINVENTQTNPTQSQQSETEDSDTPPTTAASVVETSQQVEYTRARS